MAASTDPTTVATEIERARHLPGRDDWVSPHRNLATLLAARADATPDAPFLVYFDDDAGIERRWSYAETAAAVARAAGWLRGLGIGQGDRVAFLLGNLDHTIVLYLASWALGACVAPVNAAEAPDRKRFILENARARALVSRSLYADEARELARAQGVPLALVVEPGEDAGDAIAYPAAAEAAEPVDLAAAAFDAHGVEALLIYTSGTTGAPKGVRVDQYSILADADAMAAWHGWDASLRAMCVLPIHHVNGIIVTHVTPLYVGGTAVLNARFQSRSFWGRVAREGVRVVSVVPTLLEFLLEADAAGEADPPARDVDLAALETVVCGAGPLLVDTAAAFEERFGVPLTHGYGLSETTCYNCHLPPDLDAATRRAWLTEHGFPSIGCALPHQELAILDAEGEPVADGVRGEIAVRGNVVSLGYFERPDANAEAFRGGWFRSGDEGFRQTDPAGRAFFFITGRLKELIIRGGVNYSPLEIDEVLNAHPDVRYGLAVPFANRIYGEEVAAYVVPQEGAEPDAESILDFCRERLDFARAPKVLVFGQDVPYTTTGKPKRIELSRQLADELARYRDTQFRKPKG
ncbi:MAG: acyl--CoA ligase [Proteobacteria bacterium]|nr:acyl--CoA ligase [Pseudomonadota bacterium]